MIVTTRPRSHLETLPGREPAHGHVVLRARAGGQGVHARRVAQRLEVTQFTIFRGIQKYHCTKRLFKIVTCLVL